jgi:uncharacterized phage-like protein YoqJ
MVCCFFGHRDAPKEIKPTLKRVLVDLIENKNVNMFYVGNYGSFDILVQQTLKELSEIYPIKYYVVLAYIPKKDEYTDYSNTIYFDEVNKKPYKSRIVEANKLILAKSDYVITYAKHFGNARDFKELAEKQNKTVININM